MSEKSVLEVYSVAYLHVKDLTKKRLGKRLVLSRREYIFFCVRYTFPL